MGICRRYWLSRGGVVLEGGQVIPQSGPAVSLLEGLGTQDFMGMVYLPLLLMVTKRCAVFWWQQHAYVMYASALTVYSDDPTPAVSATGHVSLLEMYRRKAARLYDAETLERLPGDLAATPAGLRQLEANASRLSVACTTRCL